MKMSAFLSSKTIYNRFRSALTDCPFLKLHLYAVKFQTLPLKLFYPVKKMNL